MAWSAGDVIFTKMARSPSDILQVKRLGQPVLWCGDGPSHPTMQYWPKWPSQQLIGLLPKWLGQPAIYCKSRSTSDVLHTKVSQQYTAYQKTRSTSAVLHTKIRSTNDVIHARSPSKYDANWMPVSTVITIFTKMARSACEAPQIMLGTKLLWPGASSTVKCFFSVSKKARPTSTVLPFSRSSLFVSRAQDRSLQEHKTLGPTVKEPASSEHGLSNAEWT